MSSKSITPANRSVALLSRRERRHVAGMEVAAALAHRDLQLRREYAQARILNDTAVVHTAMACTAATNVYADVLRKASPGAVEALRVLEAKHVAVMAQRIDDHVQGG